MMAFFFFRIVSVFNTLKALTRLVQARLFSCLVTVQTEKRETEPSCNFVRLKKRSALA